MKPSIGRIVHYVSYGTPGGEYRSECRAAIVTAVTPLTNAQAEAGDWEHFPQIVDLMVANPEGLFFNRGVVHDGGDIGHDHSGAEISARSYKGGSWHWPEQVA